MKPIFIQTFKRMFTLKNILIYFGIALVPVLIFAVAIGLNMNENTVPLPEQIDGIISFYSIMTFIWLAGIPFIVNIAAHGTGLFASEEYEGTMVLLAAKPVSRRNIVSGKILALFAASMVYQVTLLIISFFIFYFISGPDVDTVGTFFTMLPGMLLYSAFVAMFFTALSGAMSVVFKKKVAGIIITLLFLFVAFGILPIIRSILMIDNMYVNYRIYIFDLNYHFGIIFKTLMFFNNTGSISSGTMDVLGALTGTYGQSDFDPDIIALSGYPQGISGNNFISAPVILGVYIIITILLYVFIYTRMEKKDMG